MLDRRRFIAGFSWLGLGSLLGSGLPLAASAIPSVAEAKSDFRLFDALRFDGKPDDLDACGLTPIRMVYSGELFPSGNWDDPDLGHIEKKLVPKLIAENRDRVVLDIEHWEADEVDKPVAIIELMRSLLPGVRLGYYSLVPVRDYWSFQPGKEGRRIAYAQQMEKWSKLADAVDDLYPTLYAYYDDRDGWMRMADGIIAAGKQIGKPMYPFLWPQYHDQNKKLSRQMIPGDFWLQQLDKVHDSGCDGAVLWGTLSPDRRRDANGKIARLRWDPSAEWWLQTSAFVRSIDLAEGKCA